MATRRRSGGSAGIPDSELPSKQAVGPARVGPAHWTAGIKQEIKHIPKSGFANRIPDWLAQTLPKGPKQNVPLECERPGHLENPWNVRLRNAQLEYALTQDRRLQRSQHKLTAPRHQMRVV